MIEITKACTVAFMKARNSLVVRCREKCIEDFGWHQKVVHGSVKLFLAEFASNGIYEMVMTCYLK